MTAWLLTWLWQGTALAGAITLLLRCAPRTNAATKHAVWCGVLIGIAWLGWASSPQRAARALPGCGTDVDPSALEPCLNAAEPVMYVPSAPDLLITIGLGIWAAIALMNLLRLIPALHRMYAVRDRCRPFPARLEARLPLWCETKDRGRRAQLMMCDAIEGATLLGLHNPCIAIPPSLVNALSPDQLDQVILHEYAHAQRRDDWGRLAQSLALSVLWIHPAAGLVSRAMNREREMACDEWVVARTGLAKVYAQCLARAAELRVNMRATPVLASAFVGHRHELRRRVDHLLAIRGKTRRRMSLAGAAAAAVAITGLSASMQGVGFAEIEAVIFPIDAVQRLQQMQQAHGVRGVQQARRQQHVRPVPEVQPVRKEPVRSTDSEMEESRPDPLVASRSPIATTIDARAFHPRTGTAIAPIASSIAAPIAPDHSRMGIATVAKKTSIDVAKVFSRAGVSLARRF